MWAPSSKPGDRDPLIPRAKKELNKFSYGKNLGETDEYTVEFGIALRQWQTNIHYQIAFKGRPGPDVNILGVFDWAVKKQMQLLDEPVKPWIITVGGHLSTWDSGPAYLSALALQNKAVIQGVGYDAVKIPFNNASGFNELKRIVCDVKPKGVPWAIGSHSQGSIITSDFLEQEVLPNQSRPEYSNFRGGVHFGNPRRPMGVVAPWVKDPPDPKSEGLAPNCLKQKLPGVEEVSRRGDLYAEKVPGEAAEHKMSIYRLVAEGKLFGTDTLTEQLLEIALDPVGELWPLFQALTGGIQFLIDMSPHDIFDLAPVTEHFARIIA